MDRIFAWIDGELVFVGLTLFPDVFLAVEVPGLPSLRAVSVEDDVILPTVPSAYTVLEVIDVSLKSCKDLALLSLNFNAISLILSSRLVGYPEPILKNGNALQTSFGASH